MIPTATFDQLRLTMRPAGLDYSGPLLADGKRHRVRVDGDRERNSWYVLRAGPPAAAAFGCWKRGVKEIWCERNGSLSQSEWDAVQKHWQAADHERERIEAERRAKGHKPESRRKSARG